MKRLVLIPIVLMLVLTSCGTPAVASVPTPQYSPEQMAILNFSTKVYEIEAKRNALVSIYTPLRQTLGIPGMTWIMNNTYLDGVTPDNKYNLAGIPSAGLEGMTSLRNRLYLLDCPQVMQIIKDSLVHIYDSEIKIYPSCVMDLSTNTVMVVSKDNLELWKQRLLQLAPNSTDSTSYYPPEPNYYHQVIISDWYKLQSFRRDVYVKWDDILKRNGLDSSLVNK